MINKLSARLTEKLLLKGVINEDDRELYVYGLFMLLSHIMLFVAACIFGVLLNCLLESIIFYVAFQFIRRYAGGYHADTETRCEIMSSLSILVCVFIIRLSKNYDFQAILLAISAVSAVCIFSLCPLDTEEKPLSEKEYKYFKKISWIILAVISVLIAVSYIFKWNFICVPCCLSLLLEALLISAGKIKRLSVGKKPKNA